MASYYAKHVSLARSYSGGPNNLKKGIGDLTGPLFEHCIPLITVSQVRSNTLSTTCLAWRIRFHQMIGSAVTAVSAWRTIADQLQGMFTFLTPLLLLCVLSNWDLANRLSRSDLYTAHQPQREAYGLATVDSLFMISLDFPTTNTADEPSTGIVSSDPDAESSSLSVLRLERYLSEEQIYERVALGMPPLGVNKATVKRYLPEIIQNMDSNASRVEATRGTITESDERGCRRSVTTSTSTTSDGSLEPIGTCNSNDNGYMAEASDLRLLHTTSSPNQHITPSLAGLGKTDMTSIKSEHLLASSESNQKSSDTCEQDDEVERALMYVHTGYLTYVRR
jgi:hypothetical protein